MSTMPFASIWKLFLIRRNEMFRWCTPFTVRTRPPSGSCRQASSKTGKTTACVVAAWSISCADCFAIDGKSSRRSLSSGYGSLSVLVVAGMSFVLSSR
nr:MAG TPA: hypothetical protein [Caudoviricetes sp.]